MKVLTSSVSFPAKASRELPGLLSSMEHWQNPTLPVHTESTTSLRPSLRSQRHTCMSRPWLLPTGAQKQTDGYTSAVSVEFHQNHSRQRKTTMKIKRVRTKVLKESAYLMSALAVCSVLTQMTELPEWPSRIFWALLVFRFQMWISPFPELQNPTDGFKLIIINHEISVVQHFPADLSLRMLKFVFYFFFFNIMIND